MRNSFVFGMLAISFALATPGMLAAQSSYRQVSTQSLNDYSTHTPNEIPWIESLEQAKSMAAKENKYVLLHFWGAQCRPCLMLEKFVFNNPQVIGAISRNVIPVKIQDAKQPQLFAEFGVRKMPQDVIISPQGKVILKRSSPANADGYLRIMKGVNKLRNAKPRPQITGKETENHIETVRKRDAELRSQILTDQKRKSNSAKPDGIVYNPNPIDSRYHPNSVRSPQSMLRAPQSSLRDPKSSVGVPTVSNPNVDAPDHTMPQIDPRIIAELKKNRAIETPDFENGLQPRNDSVAEKLAGQNQNRVSNPHFANRSNSESRGSAKLPSNNANQNDQRIASQVPRNPTRRTANHSSRIKNEFVKTNRKVAKTQSFVPAMDGYCPVTLVSKQRFVRGDKDWGCFHRGKLFLFASKKARNQFMADPDTYFPALAGMDPVILAQEGKEVTSGIVTGLVANHQNRKLLILFSSNESKLEFIRNKDRYLQSILHHEKHRSVTRTAQQPFDKKIR